MPSDGTVVDDIVVTGVRYPTAAYWNGSIIMEDCEAWGNFWAWWESPEGGNMGNDPVFYQNAAPSNFNKAQDVRVDKFAQAVAANIMQKPNYDKVEYAAFVYKDASGNIKSTTIATGTNSGVDIANIMSEIPSNATILALVHSHPALHDYSNGAGTDYRTAPNADTLSSQDFDGLLEMGAGGGRFGSGVDYRSYVVSGNDVNEFYAWQQDRSLEGGDGPATWAVQSSDYDRNVGNTSSLVSDPSGILLLDSLYL